MQIDYTKWEPGVALAKDIVLEKCERCGKSGKKKVTKRKSGSNKVQFIHEVQLERVANEEAEDAGLVKRGQDGIWAPVPVVRTYRTKVVVLRKCEVT